MRKAGRSFMSFQDVVTTGVAVAAAAIAALGIGLFALSKAIDGVIGIARTLFKTFLEGALDVESFEAVIGVLADDQRVAARATEFLNDQVKQSGIDADEARKAYQNMAVAQRAATGAIDLGALNEQFDLLTALSSLKPDIPLDVMGRAVTRLLNGDVASLMNMLGLSAEQVAGLTDNVRQFLTGASAASEQQLGVVTRLGGGMEADASLGLEALKQLAEGLDAFDVRAAKSETAAGKIARIRGIFDTALEGIGEDLLGPLNEFLDILLEIISSPAFEEFADVIGDRMAEGLTEFVKAIAGLDPEQIEAFFAAITEGVNSLDFGEFGEDLAEVGRAIDSIHRFLPDPITGKTPAAEEAVESFQDTPLPAGVPDTGIAGLAARTGANLLPGELTQAANRAPANPTLGTKQQVEVTVTVDEEGQLNVKKVAQREGKRAAEGELNTFVGGLIKD